MELKMRYIHMYMLLKRSTRSLFIALVILIWYIYIFITYRLT